MQRTLLGVVLLGLVCSSANAAGYYIRLDTTINSNDFQEFDGVTAYSLTNTQRFEDGSGYLQGETNEEISADLSTGRLAVYQDSNVNLGGAGSTVAFGDTLTFDLAGLSSADVTLTMRVHGSFSPSLTQGMGVAGLSAGPVLLQGAQLGTVSESFDKNDFDYGQIDELLSLVVRVVPGETVAFWSFLQINHLGYGTADFANTAQMAVVVPDGVTFTSASGVFLAEVVPAPPAVWLLGTALAVLGGRRLLKQKISSTL